MRNVLLAALSAFLPVFAAAAADARIARGPVAGASPPAALVAVSGPDRVADVAAVRAYLAQAPLIRVALPQAPGNGHQAIGVTIMKRLLDLGYRGRFEVVFDDKIRDKLDLTLAGFDPLGEPVQELPGLSAVAFPLSAHLKRASIPRADVMISPDGSYVDGWQSNCEVNACITPYAWSVPEIDGEDIMDAGGALVKFSVPRPSNPARFIAERMGHSERMRAKIPGLQAVARALGRVELLPAYGLSEGHTVGRLPALLEAVELAQTQAPRLFSGGVVVPFFSYMSDATLQALRRRFEGSSGPGGVTVVSVQDVGAIKNALKRLERGQILFVRVGGVEQDVFHYFYSRQTMPGTVAGANGRNLMRVLGRPYMNTVSGWSGEYADVVARAKSPKKAMETFGFAISGLGNQFPPDIAKFFIAVKENRGGIRDAFARMPPRDDEDKIVQVMALVVARLQGDPSRFQVIADIVTAFFLKRDIDMAALTIESGFPIAESLTLGAINKIRRAAFSSRPMENAAADVRKEWSQFFLKVCRVLSALNDNSPDPK
jgi:hypothetical protein